MHFTLIILFWISFVSVIFGASLKQSTSIDDDAKELTGLVEKIWSLKPPIVKRTNLLLPCELIDKCCKGENRMKATVLMNQEMPDFNKKLAEKIMKMCMNSSTSNKADRTCSTMIESTLPDATIEKDPDVEEYISIAQAVDEDLKMLPRWLSRSCNREHLQAFLCLSNTKLVEACVKEVLQMAFDDDYIDYQQIVMMVKRVFTDMFQRLSKKFPKVNNNE